jgi:transcriptional regulator with XRE-family HTH domain
MTQVVGRTVKLGEVLGALIERQGYSRNRQKILDSVGVSAAALSQYTRDQTRPSFQKLIDLATFFDVSLDYLVFGQRTAPAMDAGPVPAMIEHALADARARTSRHAAIVRRITRVLADRVDDVAQELAETATMAREGLLHDDELLRLERMSETVDIVANSLHFDVVELHGSGTVIPGPFFDVLCENLLKGASYRFLVADSAAVTSVATLRKLLRSTLGGDVAELCSFRQTDAPLLISLCLYSIDTEVLARRDPFLKEQLFDYLDGDGSLGYVIRPNFEGHGDMLMSASHRDRAREAFEREWRRSRVIQTTP